MVNNEPVGAVQSFAEKQDRSNKRISEVGTDGTIEIVPQAPANITLTISRTAFDGLSVTEAFSRGFRNIQAQRIPFDIVVIDQFTGTGNDAIITTYHNCWFSSIGRTYKSDDYIITEDCGVDVEFVSTIRGGDAVVLSQGAGGGRQLAGTQFDDVEGLADSGARRGALDFPGLISAAF
tara:strand:- start:189 stop:722 length:534 start_codon:yes stop_codon:yes gene_type:complete